MSCAHSVGQITDGLLGRKKPGKIVPVGVYQFYLHKLSPIWSILRQNVDIEMLPDGHFHNFELKNPSHNIIDYIKFS